MLVEGDPANASVEEGLDPPNWAAARRLAHKALDDAIDFLSRVRSRPVWTPVPEETKRRIAEPLPLDPQGLENAYRDFVCNILPYPTGNIHPRFFGWVHGAGMFSGIIAEMLAAAMNSNCGGRDHGAIYVERCVIDWCKELFGYPPSSGGLLVSGTSVATFVGLAVARHARGGTTIRLRGVTSFPKLLKAYTSTEAHSSAIKAAEILGLGRDAIRLIPVNTLWQMDTDCLDKAIADDLQAGFEPFCVIGSAGTVNTGAIDDLQAIAEICRRHNLWFHVDGAFGGLCVLSEDLCSRVKGIELSDSISFDFHKWMSVQYDAGCVLVRRGELQLDAFSLQPAYLETAGRGLAGGEPWPCNLGIELSRGFRALKVWFAMKEHGMRTFGRIISQNCRQAALLAKMIEERPELELLLVPALNIVCFRFTIRAPESSLDALNREIVADLQEGGGAALSTTRIRGKLAIRVAFTNHRTRRGDLDAIVEGVVVAGNRRTAARCESPAASA